jgi:hypothetical protein
VRARVCHDVMRLNTARSADMVCHWEDSDTVAHEVFANVGRLPFHGCLLR